MFNPYSLQGKKILVTGASSGIGAGIAIDASKMGGDIVITGRNEERLSDTLGSLAASEGHEVICADLSKDEELQRLSDKLPILDGIVLCAGIIKTTPVKNIKDDALYEIFETNILSSIKLIRNLLKKKKIAKGASIVFISSVSTFNVKIGNSLYSATKGAVNSFAKALALEMAKQSIRVNCIQPGFVPSQILDKSGIEADQFLKFYAERHPLGFGSRDDIAYACIYLLSDAARWVTGSIFTIDGGYTLQ